MTGSELSVGVDDSTGGCGSGVVPDSVDESVGTEDVIFDSVELSEEVEPL